MPSSLILTAKWETIRFVFTLAAIIGYKLLTGQINTRYLFFGLRSDGTRYFSTERVQLLVVTFSIAIASRGAGTKITVRVQAAGFEDGLAGVTLA